MIDTTEWDDNDWQEHIKSISEGEVTFTCIFGSEDEFSFIAEQVEKNDDQITIYGSLYDSIGTYLGRGKIIV